jgi:two-component system, NtrC family, sensor kinase
MDVVASGADLSNDPKFAEAVARKVYYGPVYFRRESEPYMTLAIAGTRRDAGVSVAEVNLKLIWDVVPRRPRRCEARRISPACQIRLSMR